MRQRRDCFNLVECQSMVSPEMLPEGGIHLKPNCPICDAPNDVTIDNQATPGANNLLEVVHQCISCEKFFTVGFNVDSEEVYIY